MQLYNKKQKKSVLVPTKINLLLNATLLQIIFFLDAHRMFRGLQNANERSRDQQTVLFRR